MTYFNHAVFVVQTRMHHWDVWQKATDGMRAHATAENFVNE
jgi:hypothetical protein